MHIDLSGLYRLEYGGRKCVRVDFEPDREGSGWIDGRLNHRIHVESIGPEFFVAESVEAENVPARGDVCGRGSPGSLIVTRDGDENDQQSEQSDNPDLDDSGERCWKRTEARERHENIL